MSRRSIAGMVLLMWGGALAWLARREYTQAPGAELVDVSRNVPPGATFYVLSVGGQPLGFASNTVDTVPEGLSVEDRLFLEIPTGGEDPRTEALTVANLTHDLTLRDFEARFVGDGAEYAVHGAVSHDSVMSVEMLGGEASQAVRLPLRPPGVLSTHIPLYLAVRGELETGETYSFSAFDPLLLRQREIDLRVLAESTLVVPDSATPDTASGLWVAARWDTLHAWKVEQAEGGATPVTMWIDDYGKIVTARSGTGFTMERTAFEIAFYNFRRRGAVGGAAPGERGGIVRRTVLAAGAPPPGAPLAELQVRLRGIDLDAYAVAGGLQTLRGDTLTTRRHETPQRAGYRLPADTVAFRPALAAEPPMQSNDPRLQAQARQIAGRSRNAIRVAQRLNEWVYERLEKEPTTGASTALDVLEALRGDCNEHTMLYVALARAVGLPARTAAGLLYVDGSFYYHAWPEVYLGEWVPVDPTLGQFPAGAGHLRFSVGGLARRVELVPLIGHLGLDVLRAEE